MASMTFTASLLFAKSPHRLEKYESLEKGFDDMEELMELAEEMEDEEEADSIVEAFGNLRIIFSHPLLLNSYFIILS